jgi:1-acyl-sn-glycerol-3-phosphate acyltransferase
LTATAEPQSSPFRAVARVVALILLFLACLPLHLIAKVTGRSPWPPRFLGAAGRIIGARVTTTGAQVAPHSLLVANHVTWLDILILAGATGCAFVSKDEIRTAPFVGWLADQNHTLYVRRSERREALDQAAAIAEALRSPQPLALFPEGTTSDGTSLLPFRSTLLAAAAPPPPQVTVRPVAIDYGSSARELSWKDEPAKPNVLRILGRRGTFAVTIRLLDPIPPSADRKAVAHAARDAIAAALTASNPARPIL